MRSIDERFGVTQLPIHGPDAIVGGPFLGRSFDLAEVNVGLNPAKIWMLSLDTQRLLCRPRMRRHRGAPVLRLADEAGRVPGLRLGVPI